MSILRCKLSLLFVLMLLSVVTNAQSSNYTPSYVVAVYNFQVGIYRTQEEAEGVAQRLKVVEIAQNLPPASNGSLEKNIVYHQGYYKIWFRDVTLKQIETLILQLHSNAILDGGDGLMNNMQILYRQNDNIEITEGTYNEEDFVTNKQLKQALEAMQKSLEAKIGNNLSTKAKLTGWGAYTSVGIGYTDMISNWVVLKSPQYSYMGFTTRTGGDFFFFKNNLFRALAEAQYFGSRYEDRVAMHLAFQARTGKKIDNYIGLAVGYNILDMRRTFQYGTVFGPQQKAKNGFTFGIVNTYFIPFSVADVTPYVQSSLNISVNARIVLEFLGGVRFNISTIKAKSNGPTYTSPSVM